MTRTGYPKRATSRQLKCQSPYVLCFDASRALNGRGPLLQKTLGMTDSEGTTATPKEIASSISKATVRAI